MYIVIIYYIKKYRKTF